jgi:hypothetical protein
MEARMNTERKSRYVVRASYGVETVMGVGIT